MQRISVDVVPPMVVEVVAEAHVPRKRILKACQQTVPAVIPIGSPGIFVVVLIADLDVMSRLLEKKKVQPSYRVVERVLVVDAGRALIVKKVFSLKTEKQRDRKRTEEHTSELQSRFGIS